MMMTERGSVAPAAGGAVLADFDAILAGRVQATGFNADTGCRGIGRAPAARVRSCAGVPGR
ncbi:hypothetical protein ACWGUN_25155 [Streptomyces koyangensis]|uniref:hypothetical protein n=1 Tax=Streptomyces koyangensis TaxID=188770 RepID=UPI003C2E6E95